MPKFNSWKDVSDFAESAGLLERDSSRRPVWTSNNGMKKPIEKMDETHLINTIRMIRRELTQGTNHRYIIGVQYYYYLVKEGVKKKWLNMNLLNYEAGEAIGIMNYEYEKIKKKKKALRSAGEGIRNFLPSAINFEENSGISEIKVEAKVESKKESSFDSDWAEGWGC